MIRWLTDTSVLSRMHEDAVTEVMRPRLRTREVAICPLVDLELGRAARSEAEHLDQAGRRALAYPCVQMAPVDFDRALEVQRKLVASGRHRRMPLPDLLIAAVAERYDLTVLHYDHDYDTIAAVTGQPAVWVVPPGTV